MNKYQFLPLVLIYGAATMVLLFAAGNITLEVSSTTRVDKMARATCTVLVRNKGDEAASQVRMHVESQGRRISDSKLTNLGPGQSVETDFSIPTDSLSMGRHLLVIFIDYTDNAGFPFTAISHGYFVLGKDLPPQIKAEADPVELETTAALRMRFRHLENKTRKVKLQLVLPTEIAADPQQQTVDLGPLQEKEILFQLNNKSASAGSVYQVFALAEYMENGLRTGMAAPAVVRITVQERFFQRWRALILCAAALLAALFIGAQLWTRRQAKPSASAGSNSPPAPRGKKTK